MALGPSTALLLLAADAAGRADPRAWRAIDLQAVYRLRALRLPLSTDLDGSFRLNAEIISVGTELLLGQIVDTNATTLCKALSALGINVYYRSTVGDNFERVVSTIRLAASRADCIITSGGLGPTMDDLTKEAVAQAFGVALVEDAASADRVRSFFRGRGSVMAASNLKQALIFESGRALQNDFGTAPGAFLEKDGKLVFCLPGPPREMVPMLESQVAPILAARVGGDRVVLRTRVLRTCGIGESAAEERVKDLLTGDNPTAAPLLHGFEVHFRIVGRGTDAAEVDAQVAALEARLRERLGDHVYGTDSETLEAATVHALADRRLTVATAESVTGGLVAHRLTNVAGATQEILGGVVSYTNMAKEEMLGVREETLAAHGAVSREVATEMAQRIRTRLGTDFGLSITGLAGPQGGTPDKPVGLVFVGLASRSNVETWEHRFGGAREDIKNRTAQAALDALRRAALARG